MALLVTLLVLTSDHVTTSLLELLRFARMQHGMKWGHRMEHTQKHQLSQELKQAFTCAELCTHISLYNGASVEFL